MGGEEVRQLYEEISELRRLVVNRDELVQLLCERNLMLAEQCEKSTEAMLVLRRSVSDGEAARDERERGWAFALDKVGREHAAALSDVAKQLTVANERLSALSVDVKDSGHKPDKSSLREVLSVFRELPTAVKVLLIFLAAIIASHAELSSLIKLALKVE